ncbi:MAG: IS66 family transposase [Nitrosotalea sp.]
MPRFGAPRQIVFTEEQWAEHLAQDEQLRERVAALEAQLRGDGRRPPPPSWAKPNTKKDPDSSHHKPGAKEGHEAHHRPPSTAEKDTVELSLLLRACACGEEFGEPFAWSDRWVDKVIPGHVERRHYRVAHYRCRKCRRLTAARVPGRAAPPRSRFCWGTHFLVAGWHALGLTHSKIQMLLESDYGQTVSLGEVDKMLARAGKLFAPAVEAITTAIREGKEVVVDNTGWRVDGVNHFLWDFIAPEIKAALFVVDRSGGHQVPEQVLPGNPEQTVVCDGGKCFNPLKGKKRIQRDWVHIRRHAKEGLLGYEAVSDAPDWRWLKSVKAAADAALRTAKLPKGKERDRKVAEVRSRVERLLRREVEGEPARKLRKYLLERGEELWTWVGTGGLAQSNPAEQGLRFHIAGKRKVSGGSRTMVGAIRTAALASVQATARMRSIRFAEVGHQLLRGAADPFRVGPGPPGSPGPPSA